MYRKGFWVGLLVGLVLAGMVVASLAGLVVLRSHGMLGPLLGVRLRSFDWAGHGGRLAFGMPGRTFAGLVCLPVLLLVLGAAVLLAVLAAHRYWRHGGGHSHHDEQKPPEAEAPQAEQAEAEPHAQADQPPAHG